MEIKYEIPMEVQTVLNYLQDHGHESQLVGGCVRDMLLGRVPKDYDISTSALPEEVKEVFNNCFEVEVIDTGIKYGTVTALSYDIPVEVTTYRADSVTSDGRRPDSVEFGKSAEEDVYRRDFTINGLMLRDGKIVDHVGGMYSLQQREIQCIGRIEDRFKEDALRMLRAIRFASQLNFQICRSTHDYLRFCSHLLCNVSMERIRDELSKILVSNHPAKGICMLQDRGLLGIVSPELDRLKYFDQKNPRHNKDVFDHTMRVLESVPPVLELRLAALFHDVGKPDTYSEDEQGVGHFYGHHKTGADITREVLKRLKYPNEVVETVGILVYEHMARNPYFRQTGIKRLINRVGAERMPMLFSLMTADVIGHAPPYDLAEIMRMEEEVERILTEKEPMKVTDLEISGKDLIEMGMEPGPMFGEILEMLLEQVIEDPHLNYYDYLRDEANSWLEYNEQVRGE